MKKRLADWASVAEIVSGLSIVLTLVFLIFEVRDNTGVMRATAYERSLQTSIDIRLIQAQRPDVYAIAMGSIGDGRFVDYYSMSDLEKGQAWSWNSAIFLGYEKAYYSNKYGLLGESEAQRFIDQACSVLARYVPELRESVVNSLTLEYRHFLVATPECEPVRRWLESRESGN